MKLLFFFLIFLQFKFLIPKQIVTHPEFVHIAMSGSEDIVPCSHSDLEKKESWNWRLQLWWWWHWCCRLAVLKNCNHVIKLWKWNMEILITNIKKMKHKIKIIKMKVSIKLLITVNWQLLESAGQSVSVPPVLKQDRRPSKIL